MVEDQIISMCFYMEKSNFFINFYPVNHVQKGWKI